MRRLGVCLLTFSVGVAAIADQPGRVCRLDLERPLVITDATFRGYWGRASQIPEPHRARVIDLVARTLNPGPLSVANLDILSFKSDDYLSHGRRVRFNLRLRFFGGEEVLLDVNHLYAPAVVNRRLPDGGSLLERSASLMLIDVLHHAELWRTPEAMHAELRTLRRWSESSEAGHEIPSAVGARVTEHLIRVAKAIPGERAPDRRGAELSAYLHAKQDLADASSKSSARLLRGPLNE